MRNSLKFVITVALLLSGRGATAASLPYSGAQRKIASILDREAMRASVAGVFAMTEDGDTIAAFNSAAKLVPASNMKLLTTGVALRVLGPDYRYGTSLACDGPVENGVLNGDLYIVGGGDPSTGDSYKETRSLHSLFCEWKKILDAAGIRRISGSVVGDPRYFDGDDFHEDWTPEDTGYDYGAAVTGLNFFENVQKFHVVPADAEGGVVTFTPDYPETPWMKFRSCAVTSGKGGSDRTWYLNTDMVPIGEFRGSFPLGREAHNPYSNRFGAFTCAYYFYNFLNSNGIPVSGYADVSKSGKLRAELSSEGSLPAPDSVRVIGTTWSRPLKELVAEANGHSDNFYTEAFYRSIGLKVNGSASLFSSKKAMRDILSNMVRCRGVKVVDGCGLSRKNYVSPEFFVAFLRRMASDKVFPDFLASLPRPGKGTLIARFPKSDDAFKERICMKSGSMDGVRCFSGYILPSGNTSGKMIVFSVMTNNATASSFTMFRSIEDIIACLAAEN